MREPETLKEMKAEILRQLKDSETVTIILTEGDGIHELLESITDGIKGTEELNKQSRKHGDPVLCANASAMAPATLELESKKDDVAGCPSASC
jgi:hypothetical protein